VQPKLFKMMKKPVPPKSPEMNFGNKNPIEAKNSQIAYEMISKWSTVLDRNQTQKFTDSSKIEPVTVQVLNDSQIFKGSFKSELGGTMLSGVAD
jgi:hypothetical protein